MSLSYGNRITVRLEELNVWTDNPRFDQRYKEEDAITMVFITSSFKKMQELIIDISNNGLLINESIVVVKDKANKYDVYDGNRRISAIKAVQNPNLIKQTDLREKLVNLISTKNISIPIKELSVIDTNEEVANNLILRKHGPQDTGASLQNWSTWSRDNFLYTQLGQNPQNKYAYFTVKELGYSGFSKFKNKYNIDYTNLERIMSNSKTIDYFNQVKEKYNDEVYKVLLDKFLIKAQLYKKQTKQSFSRAFNKSAQIEKLLDTFDEEFSNITADTFEQLKYKVPSSNIDPSLDLDNKIIDSKITEPGKTKQYSNLNSSLLLERFKHYEINIGPNSNSCFLEMKKITEHHMKLFPISFIALIRILLETSTKEFIEALDIKMEPKPTLVDYIIKANNQLVKTDFHPMPEDHIQNLRRFIKNELAHNTGNGQYKNGQYINDLHNFAHNSGTIHDLKSLRTKLNHFLIPFIVAMSNHLSSLDHN